MAYGAESAQTGSVSLPPAEAIQHALGANHDLRSGIDELIDNAIDAQAREVAVVFHCQGFLVTQVSVHDDGCGMSEDRLQQVMRLGVHAGRGRPSIGMYGMGLKEGSFANADTLTVVSRERGSFASALEVSKGSFTGRWLDVPAVTAIWNRRNQLVALAHGTTVLWDNLTFAYTGSDVAQAGVFLSQSLERVRRHVGIRYHRFLQSGSLTIRLLMTFDDQPPQPSAPVKAVDPCGYRKSGHPGYPLVLTVDGEPGAPGVVAHVWPGRSRLDNFILEDKHGNGHQGLYVYVANRLITQGGWFGLQAESKDDKLLRVVIDDERVIDDYITISPQKGSVRLEEGFHRFIRSLRSVGDETADRKTFDEVRADAREAVRWSNRRTAAASTLPEAGSGLAPGVRQAVIDHAELTGRGPVSVMWGAVPEDDVFAIDHNENRIVLNEVYRDVLGSGTSVLHDSPVLKALIYLLAGEASTKKQTAKVNGQIGLWNEILIAAVEEEMQQR